MYVDEVRRLMTEHNLVEEQNRFDKRLIVNRKTRQEMQRLDWARTSVWVDGHTVGMCLGFGFSANIENRWHDYN
jgi:phage tail sheath gpL-like